MTSIMRQEILTTPLQIEMQLQNNTAVWQQFAQALKDKAPQSVITVARGSSDHAATYAKYLFETELCLPVSSAAPSIVSIYKTPLQITHTLVIAISQSGQSPDLLEYMRYAKSQGALTLALVNDTDSPLAEIAEYVIPLHAGKEHSVAATKTFLLSLTALLQGIAIIKNNQPLLDALQRLPAALTQVFSMDVTSYLDYFNSANAFILGRGFGFSIAGEIALKFKEVTQIHAEAFSSAEVLHGPFSLLNEPLPILVFTQHDLSLPSMLATLDRIKAAGIEPLVVCSSDTTKSLSTFSQKILLPETHTLITSILSAAYTYLLIEALAQHKHLNPDTPPLIQKITRTR